MLSFEYGIEGSPVNVNEIVDFQNCVDTNNLQEFWHIDCTYTWSN